MKKYLNKLFIATLCLVSSAAFAIPVTVNMTGDNIISNGGLCYDASCLGGTGWSDLGADTSNFNSWQNSSSLTLDLDLGTHWFAWNVTNVNTGSSRNPAALLAEILWDGGANYSSSDWEVYDIASGSLIENATEYGLNGASNIWNSVNGGAVAGISNNANWIWSSNNFGASMPQDLWIRTSITISEVPEPGSIALFAIGIIGLMFARRRHV